MFANLQNAKMEPKNILSPYGGKHFGWCKSWKTILTQLLVEFSGIRTRFVRGEHADYLTTTMAQSNR